MSENFDSVIIRLVQSFFVGFSAGLTMCSMV